MTKKVTQSIHINFDVAEKRAHRARTYTKLGQSPGAVSA